MVGAGTPVTRHRPIRVSDGQGGYNETLDDPVTLFGDWFIHENQVRFVVDFQEDVKINDIIENPLDGAIYRIIEGVRMSEAPYKTWAMERIEKPIHP